VIAAIRGTIRSTFGRVMNKAVGRFRFRFEKFGGVLSFENPPLLVTAGRAFMRSCGLAPAAGSDAWAGTEADADLAVPRLSAPVEAHLALTNKCNAGCAHCYQSSGDSDDGELGREGMLALVDTLADAGIFHVALGGGESFLLPWLFEVAEKCRARGIVPNVTTSGLALTEEQARRSVIFGRINVSLDGTDPAGYGEFRRADSFAKADRALRLLRRFHGHVGINTVVTRNNADHLEKIVRYATSLGLDEVEFLRLKPAGRGREEWAAHKPTAEQNRALLGNLLAIRKRHAISLKVDCSFAPMVAWEGSDPEVLSFFSVLGCEGGDYLVGIDAKGRAKPCSFEHDESTFVPAAEIARRWHEPATFPTYRGYSAAPPEPCASCDYKRVCRGGCRVVATFVTGDPREPDPECPRVLDWRRDRPDSVPATLREPAVTSRRSLPVV
jgi:radical SAM protein with 4Fe4S-binding SPASM domain